MKKLFASYFLTFALSAVLPQLVFAQESSSRQYGTLEGQNENHDTYLPSEGESNNSKTVLSKQDSLSNRMGIKKAINDPTKASAKKSAEDEAPFNFLYYIIQRFKTSDIIED